MHTVAEVPLYLPRGQCIVMLLAALADLRRCCTKQETIGYIRSARWFDVRADDNEPYPSQQTNEPRWHTMIAFSRKDCVETGLMFDNPPDEWDLQRSGYDQWASVRNGFTSGRFKASRCYLWSRTFKEFMQPGYVPKNELIRPKNFYRDFAFAPRSRLQAWVFDELMDELDM